jgi:hypothetical protein
MRGRIVLFLVLAVVVALVGAYVGWSANTHKAVGEPSVATPAGSPVGSAHRRTSGPGPARSRAASPAGTPPKAAPPKAAPPKASPPKGPAPKGPAPKVAPPKTCSSTAAAQPAAYTTWSSPPPPSAADRVHLGQVSTTSFDDSAQIDISEDHRALTTTFDKFVIETGKGSGACDVTRSLSMTLPVTGPAQPARANFIVQGLAYTDQAASARLTLRGNGQVKVKSFPAGFNDTYIQALEFPATPGVTYTVSVQLEVHQDPDTGGYAHLGMVSIDSGVT